MCATTATSSGIGSQHVPPYQNLDTPAQTHQLSSSNEQYVIYFPCDSVFNEQLELFVQQIALFENLPEIGKGVKGSFQDISFFGNLFVQISL